VQFVALSNKGNIPVQLKHEIIVFLYHSLNYKLSTYWSILEAKVLIIHLVFSNFSLKSNDDNTILKETLNFHQRSENMFRDSSYLKTTS
jgi:RNAse (barnase) inhibitor barstar